MLQKNSQDMRLQENHGLQNSRGGGGGKPYLASGLVYTEQVRSPYTELAASGLPNPTHLEGEVRFDQAQDQQVVTTRSPRIVIECLLIRSMLIKMYVYAIYSRFSIGTILSIRKHGYEFITTLSLSSLMSLFSLSYPPLSC